MIARDVFFVAQIVCGACWTAAYVLMIRAAAHARLPAMPVLAGAANICWEAYATFVEAWRPPMLYVNAVWFALDLVILGQTIFYVPNDFPRQRPWVLRLGVVALLPVTMGLIDFAHVHQLHVVTSAAAQNLMMSALYVVMLRRRGSAAGQSMPIAVLKMVGSAAVLVMFLHQARAEPRTLENAVSVGILALDIAYCSMLYRATRA